MALGGGTFTSQNKVLPGSYINFVSLASASASLSDRGIAAMAFELDWGADDVIEVTSGDFQKNSMKIFGYDYSHEKLKGLRDLFKNARTLYAYRLNSGGVKATCDYGVAKYSGVRGNDLKIQIQTNIDDPLKSDVKTYMGTILVDSQTITTSDKTTALVNNDYIVWTKDVEIVAQNEWVTLEGGTNADVLNANYQSFLDKIESYSFNAIGVVSTNKTINDLFSAFCKRLRDEMGIKFQSVAYNTASDYEGCINVKNKVLDTDANEASLVYWVTGLAAGMAVNKSATNKIYDGEFTVDTNYTQSQLEEAIKSGEFTLHQVGSDIRVLADINSLVTTTDEKGEVFKDNQTIRVIDQIANDIATLFNTKYSGVVANDASGRISLWADIVKHHKQLQDIRAIENFVDSDVTVDQGDTKKAVVVGDKVTPVNSMTQLYMTCVIQ